MTKSLTRITQELDQNLAQFQQLQGQLDGIYIHYLAQLGIALRRQLVMAAYHLCTRHYPEAFLKLSMGDRTDLQQQLQQLGYQNAQILPGILQQPYASDSPQAKQNLRAELLKRLPITPEQLQMIKDKLLQKSALSESDTELSPNHDADEASDEPEPIVIALDSEQLQAMLTDDESDDDEFGDDEFEDEETPTLESEATEPPQRPNLPEMMAQLAAIAQQSLASELAEAEEASETDEEDSAESIPDALVAEASAQESSSADQLPKSEPETPAAVFTPPTNPVDYLHWCKHLEGLIQDSLKSLSMQANQALQAQEVISSKLPDKLFRAAIEADEGGNNPNAAPNTMSIIVETDLAPNAKSDKTTMLPITVIRLRLAEVEFAETTVSAIRSQLREHLAQMKAIATTYRKLQKEKATAEAEAAWRSAWYEADEPRTETA